MLESRIDMRVPDTGDAKFHDSEFRASQTSPEGPRLEAGGAIRAVESMQARA